MIKYFRKMYEVEMYVSSIKGNAESFEVKWLLVQRYSDL